jgi:hypothetical protein
LAKVESVRKKPGAEQHPFVPLDPKALTMLGGISSGTVYASAGAVAAQSVSSPLQILHESVGNSVSQLFQLDV